jgi:para-nitrobenzyl esterase
VTTASTSYGAVRGLEGEVLSFRGIPFAAPPARFEPPQPPEAWSGRLDATKYRAAAPQADRPVARMLGIDLQEQSEDCLYLNVWTPSLDGKRPVMVWIHGGAFLVGSGSQPLYAGTKLASRGDIVVVTISYRLGAFGFLRGREVFGEAIPSSGNEGIADCIAALEWVRNEIAAFGGDPEDVTIAGNSAGSAIAATLLTAPPARGLFHRAILQSGALNLVLSPEQASAQASALLAELGTESPEESAATIRSMPFEELRDLQDRTPMATGALGAWAPVADGETVARDPLGALRAGEAADVPVLVGTMREEMRLYGLLDPSQAALTWDEVHERLAMILPPSGPDAASLAEAHRRCREERGESATATDAWFGIFTDSAFRNAANELAEAQSAHAPVYSYVVTRRSPAYEGRMGAGHGNELPFVFGTLDDPGMAHIAGSGPDAEALSDAMQDAWLAFIREGNPSTAALPWPAFDPDRRATMLLGDRCTVEDDPYRLERLA